MKMLSNISDFIYKYNNGWIALGLFVLFLLFSILVLPAQASKTQVFSGDIGTPDQSFCYSNEDLYHMAELYGLEGRSSYIKARFTFDLIWPILYTLFLTTSISWVYARILSVDENLRLVNMLPFLGMLFDYFENIFAALIMYRYPQPTPIIDVLTPVLTMLKWLLIISSFLFMILGFMILIWNWYQKKRIKQ
jgi:hypothetical protein